MNIITFVYNSLFLRNFENICPEFHVSMKKYGQKFQKFGKYSSRISLKWKNMASNVRNSENFCPEYNLSGKIWQEISENICPESHSSGKI